MSATEPLPVEYTRVPVALPSSLYAVHGATLSVGMEGTATVGTLQQAIEALTGVGTASQTLASSDGTDSWAWSDGSAYDYEPW